MHNAPTTSLLPLYVDAVKLCQQRGRLIGDVPLVKLERLAQQLCQSDGFAHVDWLFAVDEQARKTVTGSIDAVLTLVCQRCLGQVEIPVRAETSLVLVWSDEQAVHLPKSLDPLLMSGDTLEMLEAVEEELLLSLPIVAMHELGSCAATVIQEEVPEVLPVQEKNNPFQVLASLKSDGDKTKR